jgi:hypothetical protein
VANIGNATATGPLTFSMALPNGVNAAPQLSAAANNGWTCSTSGQNVNCTNPNTAGLAASANTPFNIPVMPTASAVGTTPTLSGSSAPAPNETTTGNNGGSFTVTAPIAAAARPDVAITFGTPTPALAETVLSSIPVTISNVGSATAMGQLVVSINIPNNVTAAVSYTSNGWFCNALGSVMTCATPNTAGLATTASTTFDLKVTPMTGTAGQYIIANGSVNVVANEIVTGNNSNTTVSALPIAAAPTVKITAKVMLQGAMLGTTDGLMRDNLRSLNLIPLTSPYSSTLSSRFANVGEATAVTTTAAVLNANAGTPDAIVDWVFVELRSTTSPFAVVKTISALVQRDGDVVAANGQPLEIATTSGSYMVSIKHRNHFGAMTSNAVTLNGTPTVIDFTAMSNTNVYNKTATMDGFEMVTMNGKRALWAGNVDANNTIKYDGTSNDRIVMGSQVTSFPANSTLSNNYPNVSTYLTGDVNMDGKTKYDGTNNDRLWLQTIIAQQFTLNTSKANNYPGMIEQMP